MLEVYVYNSVRSLKKKFAASDWNSVIDSLDLIKAYEGWICTIIYPDNDRQSLIYVNGEWRN